MHTIEQQIQQLVLDLGIPSEQQAEAVEVLSKRFQQIVLHTMLRAMDAAQKQQFSIALNDPETLEQRITEITAGIPGLQQAIEQALLHEHDVIKDSMQS